MLWLSGFASDTRGCGMTDLLLRESLAIRHFVDIVSLMLKETIECAMRRVDIELSTQSHHSRRTYLRVHRQRLSASKCHNRPSNSHSRRRSPPRTLFARTCTLWQDKPSDDVFDRCSRESQSSRGIVYKCVYKTGHRSLFSSHLQR